MTERLTAERLRDLLRYDPLSGLFTRLVRTSNNKGKVGDIAGSINDQGYLWIRIDGKSYVAHRLAHLYMVGEWPENHLDHINGSRADNRWSNLREATRHENNMNMKKRVNNTSGFKGVNRERGKWRAKITLDGKSYILGYFDTPEEASLYYEGAATILFGNFKRITIIIEGQ